MWGAFGRRGRRLGRRGGAAGGWRNAGPSGCRVGPQDGAAAAVADGTVDGPTDRRWQRCEDDLAALAVHFQDAVAVPFAEVLDVGAAGLEDPQAEHRDEGEVVGVRGEPGGGQRRLELQGVSPS